MKSSAQNSLLHRFYVNHTAWLYAWLSKKTASRPDAADLTQETFLKLLLNDDLAAVVEPRAYITTIARRLMANHFRRRNIERACLEALAQMPQVQAPSPEALAITIETVIKIDEMLDGLPPKVRRAFLWCQLEGLSHAEIASRLEVSVSSV